MKTRILQGRQVSTVRPDSLTAAIKRKTKRNEAKLRGRRATRVGNYIFKTLVKAYKELLEKDAGINNA